jgi:hypothetical protein
MASQLNKVLPESVRRRLGSVEVTQTETARRFDPSWKWRVIAPASGETERWRRPGRRSDNLTNLVRYP